MPEERFKVCPHDQMPDKMMVEFWRGKTFAAGIYPHQDGIRIVSKFMTGVREEPGFPQTAVIMLGNMVGVPKTMEELTGDISVRFAGIEKTPGGKFSILYVADQHHLLEPGKRYRITIEDLTFEEYKGKGGD